MTRRRALFLDKDGVINVERPYVCAPGRTDFIGGIFELCRNANVRGWLVIVATNQAGIARGYYSERQFLEYMDWVRAQFRAHGASLDAVYYCPHHPVHGIGEYRKACECRKPAPGMLFRAQRAWGVDMSASILVGDKRSDIEAGTAASVGHCIMVRTVKQGDSGQISLDDEFVREVAALLDTRPTATS